MKHRKVNVTEFVGGYFPLYWEVDLQVDAHPRVHHRSGRRLPLLTSNSNDEGNR